MRLLTSDDIFETYQKIYQRGYLYLFSKLNFSKKKRTKSTFNSFNFDSSNYWIIPKVRERWNYLVSGSKDIAYEQYFVEKYLVGKENLTMLSLGSGTCSHELKFARYPQFKKVICIDFSEKLLGEAKTNATKNEISNIEFIVNDVDKFKINSLSYDVILFHSSLHHFKHIPKLLERVYLGLKDDGILLINDYVGPNRLQLKKGQLKEINRLLNDIPKDYRKRVVTNKYKQSVSGPGLLRMLITDPSEAVESVTILPAIRARFDTIEEKNLGGDLLMWIFKDTSHNFVHEDTKTNEILENIFLAEDEYLRHVSSNFVLGIYKKKHGLS